jgi:hypothetical protein
MEPTLGSPLLGIVTELTNPTDSRASLSQDTLTLVGALTKVRFALSVLADIVI